MFLQTDFKEDDVKNILIKASIIAAVIMAACVFMAFIEGSQHQIAKKWADPEEAPCVMFNPETGAAEGYIKYADLDGDGKEEIIVPYRMKISQETRENKASIYTQILSIDIVRNGKKIKGFIEIDLAYTRAPKPYITTAKIFPGETQKIFLMIYDGVDKEKVDQADKRCTILWNGLDAKDQKREKQEFESAKMPWRFILKQFSPGTPTLTEFYSKTEESSGKFYIKTIMKDAKWPPIPMKEIKAFEEEVKKYQENIFWEYSY
jgi:hypothetical protein